MNKTELVETISRRTDVSKKDVDAVLTTFFDVVAQVVASGKEALTIPGWLKVEQTTRSARMGRNPQTGEAIKIPESKGVKLSAGATLKAIAKGTKPAPS
jgi:DNA-binding protein HU-beta